MAGIKRRNFSGARERAAIKLRTRYSSVYWIVAIGASTVSAVVVCNKRAASKNNTNYLTTVFRIISLKSACFIF